jgi:hypothetical protein
MARLTDAAADDVSAGIEEYANIRLKTYAGDYATFYAAFNVIAQAGSGAQTAAASGAANAANYISTIVLERLYFYIATDKAGLDAGLFRLAFGYGQAFSPSDFLSPRNPLFPDARPRAILGAAFSVYPTAMSSLRVFATAPRDPLLSNRDGLIYGLSAELHGRRLSAQALAAYEAKTAAVPDGIYRAGASVKADVLVGLYADLLYEHAPVTVAPEGLAASIPNGHNGLAACLGADYTVALFAKPLYLAAEYLYSAEGSVTAYSATNRTGFRHRHYIYARSSYSLDDYTTLAAACLAGPEDGSLSPSLTISHEFFQGLSLTTTARFPLGDGELGPEAGSVSALYSVKVTLRF